MQKVGNISKAPKASNLFIIRGNRVQLFNFETEKVLKEVAFNTNPDQFELKSQASANGKLYLVNSASEFAILNLDGDVILREQEKGICKMGFVDKSDQFVFKITKRDSAYTLVLLGLNKAELARSNSRPSRARCATSRKSSTAFTSPARTIT